MGMGICFKLIIGDWCEAMFASFPFTHMESTIVGRAPKAPAPVVEAAEGRLHVCEWEAGKHSLTPIPNDWLKTYTHTHTQIFIKPRKDKI